MAAYWYTDVATVDAYATATGDTIWATKTTPVKKYCMEQATKRIEQEIGQPRTNAGTIPFGYGSQLLREAAKFVVLDVARTINQILTNDKNRVLTDASFSDGILSVSPAKSIPLDDRAKELIDSFLDSCGLKKSKSQWSRA